MKGRPIVVAAIAVSLFLYLALRAAFACGPFFSDSYLVEGDEDNVLDLPPTGFYAELRRIADMEPPADDAGGRLTDPAVHWRNTLAADEADLAAALREAQWDESRTSQTLAAYSSLRRSVKLQADGAEADVSYRKTATRTPAFFELPTSPTLLATLPAEFGLYLKGAILWKSGRPQPAAEAWRAVLALPAGERRRRSTWAAFMAGKALMAADPAQAVALFEQTRALAGQGFADPLRLATESLGWQARVEMDRGDPVAAARLYFEQYQKGSESQRSAAALSLNLLCSKCVAKDPEMGKALIADPLARDIGVAWLVSHFDRPRWSLSDSDHRTECSQTWLNALRQSGEDVPDPLAERLAYLAYGIGRFDEARHWLSLVGKPTSRGQWVQAKILLRDGKIDEALAILRSIRDDAPVVCPFGYWAIRETGAGPAINAEIGALELGRGEYPSALDSFLRGPAWEDAAYVADRVLSADELEVFLSQRRNFPLTPEKTNDLRGLLSRRFTRAQKWDKALEYCPTQWAESLKRYKDNLLEARDAAQSKRDRAVHLFEAAKVARVDGMEIMGTEVAPDWTVYEGRLDRYSHSGPNWEPGPPYPPRFAAAAPRFEDLNANLRKVLSATDDEKQRVLRSAPSPDRRFHYRWVASDLAWQASKLLPDNDPFLAQVLYHGGYWIMLRDDAGADKFYQALVRRCSRLPVGQEADTLRWFPRNPTGIERIETHSGIR